jgi:hypothetical protein
LLLGYGGKGQALSGIRTGLQIRKVTNPARRRSGLPFPLGERQYNLAFKPNAGVLPGLGLDTAKA